MNILASAINLTFKNPGNPCSGILFIGDPHVWSRQPGRRRDERFLLTVIGKLEQAAQIANDRNLQAVCLGDLLNDRHDDDTEMLILLTRALQKFDRKLMSLVGNHDKDELWLSERNSLLLLEVANQIELIDRTGFWGKLDIEKDGQHMSVAIGGTPYGVEIPHDIASLTQGGVNGKHTRAHENLNVDKIVWLTHHDLAFEGAYPGSTELHEVLGADLVVNGHMHGTTLPHRYGETSWYNPGNITRMSVDMANHIPSVWAWSPFNKDPMLSAQGVHVPKLERIELKHVPGAEIFDFEGRHAKVQAVVEPQVNTSGSAFVARIKLGQNAKKTDDAEFIVTSLSEIMDHRKTGTGARIVLERLAQKSIEGDDKCP